MNVKQAKGDTEERAAVEATHPRPVLEVLANLRQGKVLDQVAIELNRVVRGVMECRDPKSGTVSLELKIGRLPKHGNAVQVRAKVVGKAPEDPPPEDLMFSDQDGNLFTRDPNQFDAFEQGLQVRSGK